MMPVPNPAAHPMYFYPGQNMSPVPPQMGHIGDKNASPSMPTGVQHTPNVKTCAARSLGGEFNVVESDRNERESSPSRSGQINLQKLKSAFKGAGIEYIESKVNENEKAVSDNNEVMELISRVREAGGKVVKNADKTLTIHVPESKAKCGGGKQKVNEANSIDATTGDKVIKILEDGTVVTVITSKPSASECNSSSSNSSSLMASHKKQPDSK